MDNKEYIDNKYLTEELVKEYKNAREKIRTSENSDMLDCICDDELIDEYTAVIVDSINSDMHKYLHSNDHKIVGNLGNIDYDYPRHRSGGSQNIFDRAMVNDLITRLDNNCQDEQTKADRHWLVDWFFERFGAYNLFYNSQTMLAESICQYEQEN